MGNISDNLFKSFLNLDKNLLDNKNIKEFILSFFQPVTPFCKVDFIFFHDKNILASQFDFFDVNSAGLDLDEILNGNKDFCLYEINKVFYAFFYMGESCVSSPFFLVICFVEKPEDNELYDLKLCIHEIIRLFEIFNEKSFQGDGENLKNENIILKSSLKKRSRLGNIIGKSERMQNIYEIILKASESNAHVIIYGESGTGKELVANEIHRLSSRSENSFIAVNCGAISEKLIESEFFGYKKGAFTGADTDKEGYLDRANQGVLFLDEIGEIPLGMQVKLLRVIDGDGYIPVGGTDVKKPDLRIIAATNRNLKELVKERVMREDFFYRIHVIPVKLPPLRERKDDIPLLVEHFISSMEIKDPPVITGRLLNSFEKYSWPGNIRELQNIISRYIALGDDGILNNFESEKNFEPVIETDYMRPLSDIVSEFEEKIIRMALEKNKWQKKKTASFLGLHRKTLFQKIKKYGIN